MIEGGGPVPHGGWPYNERLHVTRRRFRLLVDRPVRQAAIAVAATWLAFMAALLVGREIVDATSFVVAAISGLALVAIGFAAASRSRTIVPRADARIQLVLFALTIGIAVGLANLGANWLMSESHPLLRVLLTARLTTAPSLEGLFAAPIVEEVAVRLFFMSCVAWLVFTRTKRAGFAFATALIVSSLAFALLHLDRPVPEDTTLANYYRLALVAKYFVLALPLGWIFWRWGLPYAMYAHIAANAVHDALYDTLL